MIRFSRVFNAEATLDCFADRGILLLQKKIPGSPRNDVRMAPRNDGGMSLRNDEGMSSVMTESDLIISFACTG